ncbi:bactericidal permeability-increasing protein-like [Hemicordylus capensis]|uniref:bactericidal permeability-increasing protein-like n=1 Tax=Hemicordylus capensis TaxID=884348 RepID=UPI00230257C7|nr:bactericidal permeability-increasing protein-like [Hemicordylus capensis]
MATGNLLLASLLLSLALVLAKGTTNSGFVGRITEKGLDYARQVGVAALQQKLATLTLPDFSGSFKVPLLPNIQYKLYSLKIQHFQLPSSTIAPIPDAGLKVSITNAFAELTGDWEVKSWKLKLHGSFDLKAKRLSIDVGLKLGTDATGRPTAATSDCIVHFIDVNVHFSGKLSRLYNLFHKKIESWFRKTMKSKVCEEVTSSVSSKLQPFLQTLSVTAKIDHVAGIDYSLVGPPVATNSSLDLDLKGEFFSLIHRSPAPFPAPALAFPVDHDRMLYSGISSYLFNTAGIVYFKAGALAYEITDDMIPKELKIRLNTSSFGPFIPEVEKRYPNMLMKLHVSLSSAPSLSITPEGLLLAPEVDVQAFAILPNSTLAPLFGLGASASALAKVAASSTKIFGALELSRLQLSLKHSDVGPFSVQLTQILINFYASSTLIPQINARLAEGFPLPLLDHVQLSNLILEPRQDFLLFGADAHYG